MVEVEVELPVFGFVADVPATVAVRQEDAAAVTPVKPRQKILSGKACAVETVSKVLNGQVHAGKR